VWLGTGVLTQIPGIKGLTLIRIRNPTGAWTAGIATGSASAGRQARSRGASGGNGEDRKLLCQAFALTFGTLWLLRSDNQSFEPVVTRFARVFENRHFAPSSNNPQRLEFTGYTRRS
jgi:hypothetical protein